MVDIIDEATKRFLSTSFPPPPHLPLSGESSYCVSPSVITVGWLPSTKLDRLGKIAARLHKSESSLRL